MGRFSGFGVTLRQIGRGKVTEHFPKEKRPKPERFHGRHVLNRYEDGMEKCIGCELCAGVCPAKCIYVRGADNPPDAPVSPGERYGFVYEINYLRCIHCDLCVEACPTEAITETKLFEFSFANRAGRDLHQGRAARRRRRPRPAPAVGAVARRRGRRHQRVDARDGAVGPGRVRGPGRLVGRARLRRPRARARPVRRAARGEPTTPPTSRRARRAGEAATVVTVVLFFVVAALALGGALGVVLARNPVHSALLLVVTLVSVAVFFLHAGRRPARRGADHRLRRRDRRAVPVRDHAARRRPRGVASTSRCRYQRADRARARRDRARARSSSSPATSGRPGKAASPADAIKGGTAVGGNVERVARVLFTDFLWPFEITAVLLVLAVVGAVVLARRSGAARRATPRARSELVIAASTITVDLLPRARGAALHHRRGRRARAPQRAS